MATTNSTIEKIAPMFTDLLIKKIECLKRIGKNRGLRALNKVCPATSEGQSITAEMS